MSKVSQSRVICEPRTVYRSAKVFPRSRWAKIAAWLLSHTKHDVACEVHEANIRYVDVNTESVADMVSALMNVQSLRLAIKDEIDRVVVGPDHYMKIVREQLDSPMSMFLQTRVFDGREVRLCGFHVQFVPWIEGFAVIPKIRKVDA